MNQDTTAANQAIRAIREIPDMHPAIACVILANLANRLSSSAWNGLTVVEDAVEHMDSAIAVLIA